ncbi:hypothetical protein, partial [Rhodoplanes serenus]|uniref:hypothetical protein n=1 Tax=Rhodoplanes serenus TaxID=200615 RepID=UPI000DBC39E5
FWADVREAGCTHIHHLGGIIQILLKQPPSPLDRDHDVRIAWGGAVITPLGGEGSGAAVGGRDASGPPLRAEGGSAAPAGAG